MQEVTVSAIGGEVPTNEAREIIEFSKPYVVNVALVGIADLLFHRWNCEALDVKGKSPKGSKARNTDSIETFVYRDDNSNICIPGENLRQSVINAAKFRQDPRSPRKSAIDLYKAGVISLSPLASLGLTKWDYEHKCRVAIQRNGITRTRPAIKAGWTTEVQLLVNLPEYISPSDLSDVVTNAGRLVGLGDFRPTYGRFRVAAFDIGFET